MFSVKLPLGKPSALPFQTVPVKFRYNGYPGNRNMVSAIAAFSTESLNLLRLRLSGFYLAPDDKSGYSALAKVHIRCM